MIKIEFKEAQAMKGAIGKFDFNDDGIFNDSFFRTFGRDSWRKSYELRSVLNYIPTQDPMLDRSEILKQLGISQQEDELFQEQYKNV